MQFSKNKAALAFLALIITASGCTDTGGSGVSITQNTGITVQEFDVFPNEVPETETVQLRTTLKNTGGQEASQVSVELFNIPFTGDGAWSGQQTVDFNNLRPADPDADIPASPNTQVVSLTAPDLQDDVKIPYDIYGSLQFRYTTVGTSEMVLVSQQRYQDNGATRSQPAVDNTGGPIQISIRTRSPIVFYEGTTTQPQFCVVLDNVGTGTPYLPSQPDSDEGRNKVSITVRTAGNLGITPQDGSGSSTTVDMAAGVSCFDVDPGNLESEQTTLPITVTADYIYEKEMQTSVTVNGRP